MFVCVCVWGGGEGGGVSVILCSIWARLFESWLALTQRLGLAP